ncbi:MAG: DUF2721 domain-containing protein [Chloroflexota bacterium]|nr:DUF2721 domain-containing protein [Chloroflexota bacterium]MDE3101505.1 DUF2721 domain-containing protein [Chloroflexota bacterium]
MTVQAVAQIIQFILAPVVMISAAGLLLLGLLTRYGAVNDRIRELVHERFDLLRSLARSQDPFGRERLAEIDAQMPLLTGHLRRLHNAVLALYVSVVAFVASMFAIGVAAATGSSLLATLALAIFLVGTAVVLVAMALAVVELRAAQAAVEYEVRRVAALSASGEVEHSPPTDHPRPGTPAGTRA